MGESLGWLNALFDGLWPRVNAAVQKVVHEEVTSHIQRQMPPMLQNSTHFQEFTLGEVPPELGPIKVYEVPNGLKVTLAMRYLSHVDIRLKVGPVSVGLKELSFSGELVVKLEQLIDEVPVVGGIVIYFLNPPRVDFSLTGLGLAAEIPGVHGIIRRAIDAAVNNSIVLPNQVAIPLGTEKQGVDRADIMHAKPLGMLRVGVMSAEGLQVPQRPDSDKDVADAYVVLKTVDERWQSSTAEGSCDPTWSEEERGDLLVYDREQRLWATVLDRDQESETGDVIGVTADLPLHMALSFPPEGSPLTLYAREHVVDEAEDTRGELTLNFRFLEFLPGEISGDKLVLCVKVHNIALPMELAPGGRVQLQAKLKTSGRKVHATPVGKEAAVHAGSLVVSDVLRDVIRRASDKGLSVEDIAEIAAVKTDDVEAVLQGGDVAEETVNARTRSLAQIDSCLYLPFPAEMLDVESVELTVADKKGGPLASLSVSMSNLAEAEGLTQAEVFTMPTANGEEEIEAHISLSLLGTHEVVPESE